MSGFGPGGVSASDRIARRAAPPLPDLTAFAVRLEPRKRVLGNGLVAIAARNRISPSIAVQGSVFGGALLDTEETSGLANLAARLLLFGTRTRSATEIAESLDFVGASLSTWGGRHAVRFSGRALSKDRDDVLAILADALRNPIFPDGELTREKGRVRTMILEEEDDPASVAENTFFAELYPPEHPYHRNVLGTEPTVEALHREVLAEWHRSQFRPDRAIVCLAGDFAPEEVLDRLERLLGDWKPAGDTGPISVPDGPPARRRRVDRFLPGKAQSEIASGTGGIPRSHADYYPLLVGNYVLGQMGMGGKLGRRVREEEGLAYSVHSRFDASIGAGPFLIRAGVNPSNVDRAMEGIQAVLERVLREGIETSEVEEAKRSLAASVPRRMETNEGIAGELHEAQFLGLGLDYPERFPSILAGVTRDQAFEALRRHVRPAERVTVVAGSPVTVVAGPPVTVVAGPPAGG